MGQFCLGHIIFLYSQYHRLTRPDRLLRDYFADLLLEPEGPIWNHTDLNRISEDLTRPVSENMDQFDTPQPLPESDCRAIVRQINLTSNLYRQTPPFYLEDGTMVEAQPSI